MSCVAGFDSDWQVLVEMACDAAETEEREQKLATKVNQTLKTVSVEATLSAEEIMGVESFDESIIKPSRSNAPMTTPNLFSSANANVLKADVIDDEFVLPKDVSRTS